jgi:hypothetical protein
VWPKSKAIRTAPLSKHTSKGIFRSSHLGFSHLNQLLPHPYLLYIILYINNHLISSLFSLFLSSLLSLSLSSFPFTGAHARMLPVAWYCSKRSDRGRDSVHRGVRSNATFGVAFGLACSAADSLRQAGIRYSSKKVRANNLIYKNMPQCSLSNLLEFFISKTSANIMYKLWAPSKSK